MDGWNTTFLLGRPVFRGYVSFREGISEKNPSICFCLLAMPSSRSQDVDTIDSSIDGISGGGSKMWANHNAATINTDSPATRFLTSRQWLPGVNQDESFLGKSLTLPPIIMEVENGALP